ncbi:uncharacterized protein LOC113744351 [Larimichthys crocea]|uniref:Uncharacterized protein n=2 Tax=Larimichthys crocea TaxID=215358 RepID=A0ACD3R4F7_LARCR|nr:uncharacterized protein LOC113744351 [Larimichthys crocea]AQN67823.1 interleukin-13 [Larimichthys crocea]TMS14309.1 hypothetical protein E3U43_022789 [Larimichthys crocea]
MMMLLLVSTLVLLVNPALTNPLHQQKSPNNLNHIFDLAENYNKSLAQAFFVEDVSHLAEGKNKCDDKFFCKVHDILNKFGKKHNIIDKKKEEGLVRNLEAYVDGRNINCTELLKDMVPSREERPIPVLIGHLMRCIQNRNLNGASKDM